MINIQNKLGSAGNDDPQEIPFYLFTNPVANTANTYIIMPGQVKVKLVIVDNYLNPVATSSFIRSDTAWVGLTLADDSLFIEGEVYRVYYTMSVEGKEDFYKGHGDVLICYERPAQLTCLKYTE